MCFVLSYFTVQASLKGTYTVNPAKPASALNYKTIKSAAWDLCFGSRFDGGTPNGRGVSGPVVINIADGTYYEQVRFGAIKGASAVNTITFQSASGDSSKVILLFGSYNSIYNNNYSLFLDTAAYLTFRQLTFSTAGYIANNIIKISLVNNVRFLNNVIRGNSGATLVSITNNDSPLVFNNNHFVNGYYCINAKGNSSKSGMKLDIENNLLDSFFYEAIYLTLEDSFTIAHNRFINRNTPVTAIEIYYCYNWFRIDGNYLTSQLLVNNAGTIKGTPGIISNNMVTINLPSNSYITGIMIDLFERVMLVNNSVLLYGGYSPGSKAFSVGTPINTNYGTVLMFNNNLINTAAGFAVYSGGKTTNDTFDRNNYYSTGKYLGSVNGTAEKTLANWKSGVSMDNNSISTLPWYISNTDLHAQSPVIRVGAYKALAKYDFDGKLRSSPTVAIGANEFSPVKEDIGIFAIDSPATPFCAGTRNVYARIANFGKDTIKSATINWSVNGTGQTSYSWSGTLDTGKVSGLLKLGTYKFQANTPVIITEWTSGPNGKTDSSNVNDTMRFTTTAALNGNYSIGGSSPDFHTFTEAIGALNTRGICGSVIFNVRNGIYQEQLGIDSIPGTGSAANVTFQSQSGDSSATVLQWLSSDGNSNMNYTISFNRKAQYVTFKGMTISRPGEGQFRRVIIIDDYTNKISLFNNIIKNKVDNYTYNQLIVGGGKNLVIKNNFMHGGYNAIDLYTGTNTGLTNISGNRIDSFYLNAIYEKYYDSLLISNNNISNNLSRNGYAIYFNLASSSGYKYFYEVSGNRISMPNGGTGIFGYGQYGVVAMIANNFISIKNVSALNYGISTAYNVYLYNNNILMYGDTLKKSYCVYSTTSLGFGPDTVYNNNFINLAKGYTLYAPSTGKSMMDYNNFHTNGSILANWNGKTVANLAALQTADAMDKHSISMDPFYSSFTDLHVHALALNGAAKSLKPVKIDIDGDKRDPTAPDIGADEFTPVKTDAGVVSVDSPAVVFCAGYNKVFVRVKNFGYDTLTSFSVGWSINSVSQSSYSWSGKLLPGASIQLNPGTINFLSNTAYNIKSWTYAPNGTTDGNLSNDTSSLMLAAGMSGTYKIGGTGSDYQTINQALNALYLRGICGATVFKIADGTYLESVYFHTIIGANSINTITFQSASADSSQVILKNPGATNEKYVVKFDSASWITIKNITMQGAGQGDTSVVKMVNSAHLSLIGNRILASYSCIHTIDGTSPPKDSFITIKGNHVSGGLYAIALSGFRTNTRGWISIENNIIDGAGTAGIFLNYYDSIAISGNLIQNFSGEGNIGVYISNLLLGSSTALITKNKIFVVNGAGLSLSYIGGNRKSPLTINNNFISSFNGSGIDGTSYDSIVDIYDNNILVYGANTASMGMYYSFGYPKSGPGVNFCGNNIINLAGGQVLYINASKVMKSENYNNFFTNGSVFGQLGTVANISDLATWKLYSNEDTNSLNVNPLYISKTDLHIQNTALFQKGKAVSYIKTDIDGRIRNPTKPTIGAHEFHPVNNDAGISAIDSPYHSYCGNDVNIKVTLYNYGVFNLKSATIKWQVNGVSQKSYSWTGDLATSGTDTINLGIYTFGSAKSYSIKAWTEIPNGIKDGDSSNDTISVANLTQGMGGIYTIGGTSPDYLTFNAAVADLTAKGLCSSVIFNVRDGIYNEHVKIGRIRGASSRYTITFQSQSLDSSKVILTSVSGSKYYSGNPTLNLAGCIYATFNEITIQRTGSITDYEGDVVELNKSASYNTITHCQLLGLPGTQPIFSVVVVPNDTNCNYNVFNQNLLRYGFAGIYWYTYGTDSMNSFTNNIFDSLYEYGIWMHGSGEMTIDGNLIGNFVGYKYAMGVYFDFCMNIRYITNNKIQMDSGFTALYLFGCLNSGKRALVANNYLTSAGVSDYFIGGGPLMVRYCNNADYVFNSVNYYGKDTLCAGMNFVDNGNAAYTFDIVNNTVVNSSGGKAIIINLSKTWNKMLRTMDYNNWYVTSNAKYLGSYKQTNYSTLSAWKTATGKDTNSISIEPGYRTLTNLDLRTRALNKLGKALTLVSKDIYGTIRNSTKPTIGAYEIPVYANDMGATGLVLPGNLTCGDSLTPVLVKFQNYGYKTQSKVPVVITMTGADTVTITDTAKGTYLPGNTDSFLLKPTFNTYKGGTYHFEIRTALAGDQNHDNDSFRISLRFYKHAVPAYSFNNAACPVDTVFFKDLSTVSAEDTIAAWFWNFGDTISGSPGSKSSTLQNSNHLYSSPGNYKATLKVTTKNGCTSAKTQIITVNKPPIARFYTNPTCIGFNTFFLDTSIANNKTVSYLWDFGDKGSSAADSPAHFYAKTGQYKVKLVVNTVDGCSDTFYNNVMVVHPVAAFKVVPSRCEGNNSYFQDSSTASGGDSIISRFWDFGDGITSDSISDPVHVYKKPGTYKAVLKIKTKYGCQDSFSNNVIIIAGPRARFGFTSGCLNDNTVFIDSTVILAGSSSYSWQFGDSSISPLQNPVHLYKKAGLFFVRMMVSTFPECTDSFAINVTVTDLPHPKISGDSVICAGSQSHLKINPRPGNTYLWSSIPAGLSTTDTAIQVSPLADTKYMVTEKVTISSCTNKDSFIVNVLPVPHPVINGSTIVCTDSVTNHYEVINNAGSRYLWQIASGKINSDSSLSNIQVIWPDTGSGYLRIKETNASGCRDSDQAFVRFTKLHHKPFSLDDTCLGDLTQFADSEKTSHKSNWTFGDGTGSDSLNPPHSYKSAGSYQVAEFVSTEIGCKDSFSRYITINPAPVFKLNIKQDTGRSFLFSATDTNYKDYNWDFGDGTNSDKHTVYHDFLKDLQNLKVNLRATTNFGCTALVDTILNVKNNVVKDSINIYPDPFSDHITIYTSLTTKAGFTFMMYDAIGRRIIQAQTWNHDPGVYRDNIKFSEATLSQGMYIIYLVVNNKTIIRKMIFAHY